MEEINDTVNILSKNIRLNENEEETRLDMIVLLLLFTIIVRKRDGWSILLLLLVVSYWVL
jgi:hypothetical protein